MARVMSRDPYYARSGSRLDYALDFKDYVFPTRSEMMKEPVEGEVWTNKQTREQRVIMWLDASLVVTRKVRGDAKSTVSHDRRAFDRDWFKAGPWPTLEDAKAAGSYSDWHNASKVSDESLDERMRAHLNKAQLGGTDLLVWGDHVTLAYKMESGDVRVLRAKIDGLATIRRRY